jgi:hypothetical protein
MDPRDPKANSARRNLSYDESKLYQMATLMANDDDFAIFKKFSELNFFNLLHIQHCLTALEKDLCENLENGLSVIEITVEIRQLLKDYSTPCYCNLIYRVLINSKTQRTWRFQP